MTDISMFVLGSELFIRKGGMIESEGLDRQQEWNDGRRDIEAEGMKEKT